MIDEKHPGFFYRILDNGELRSYLQDVEDGLTATSLSKEQTDRVFSEVILEIQNKGLFK